MLVSYILGGIHFDFDHSRFAQGAQKVRSLFHENLGQAPRSLANEEFTVNFNGITIIW